MGGIAADRPGGKRPGKAAKAPLRPGWLSSLTWPRGSAICGPGSRSSCSPGWTAPAATSVPGDNPPARRWRVQHPIGLHRAQILTVEGLRILVSELEALDRTPVIDIKPVLDPVAER